MTADPIESLTALDWPITTMACQAESFPCPGRAQYLIETHAVCHCNDEGLNPYGNHVLLLCAGCLSLLTQYIACMVARLVAEARGRPVSCETCGAPVAEASDVLRAVTSLA